MRVLRTRTGLAKLSQGLRLPSPIGTVDSGAVTRRATLALLSVTLFLLAFPLTIGKPGMPPTLKSDEPAYYLMALSLVRDGDLRLEPADLDRAFQEFPFRPISNLILMTDDGWKTAYFGKPYLYSLFAAPFAGLAGADGMVFFNMLLLVAMMWMGALYLARSDPGGPAAMLAAGFFLVSAGFAYVFWLHPEVFNMAAVAACLFFGLRPPAGSTRRTALWAALSGAVLALGVYNKPVIAAIGLAPLAYHALASRWAAVGAWLAAAALALAASVGLAIALTGHPTPYLGVERQGVVLCSSETPPISRATAATASPKADRPTGGAWSWIFRVPAVRPGRLAENLLYFFVGRHTGLWLYFPFAGLAVLLFLLHERRSAWRWVLLGSLALVGLFFLIFIPANWQGGGGFIGNRYFVNVYPAFLFLIGRIRPRWTLAATYAVGGLFLGPILLTPFGAEMPEPTLQAHVRNAPFRYFPLELTLREVPGYQSVDLPGLEILGRKDAVLPRGEGLWLEGASRVELLILSAEPLAEPVDLLLSSPAPGNRIEVSMGDDDQELTLGPGTERGAQTILSLRPGGPSRVTHRSETPTYVYRLVITPETGRVETWTRRFPPPRCPGSGFAYDETLEDNFYVGAEVTLLGTGDVLERDVFGAAWRDVRSRRRVLAGQTFYVEAGLVNTSPAAWSGGGAARVRASYHWLDTEGRQVVFNGARTDLDLPVASGAETRIRIEVTAPERPGDYVLELDPLYEHVAWFSQRRVAPYRLPVTVLPAAAPGANQAPPPASSAPPGPR